MNTYQWLCILGIPTIIATLVITTVTIIFKKEKEKNNRIENVGLGVQALLRAQMIEEYNKWNDKGYAPIYARQNFENCWSRYHSLGANGVMDDIHIKFLALPTEPPVEEE